MEERDGIATASPDDFQSDESLLFADRAELEDEQNSSQKLYYRISEVAEMFHVQPSTIRFWEKEFNTIKPRKNSKGNRFFTQRDIDNIALIHYYVKERRLTLEGARKKIKENKEDAENTFRIVQSLKRVRGMLMEIKANLDAE